VRDLAQKDSCERPITWDGLVLEVITTGAAMTGASQTKTIHEFLAENPNVDVSEAHEALWNIISELKDRTEALFPVERQAACEGLEYWSTDDGTWQGSMNTFTGPGVEHMALTWIGNPRASIVDVSFQVFLGPETDVPHFIQDFGLIPDLFHYSELIPRRDVMVDLDYLNRYYEPDNVDFLELRGDPRVTWSVSHGVYMRAFNSPNCHSYTMERTPEMIDVLRESVLKRFERWVGWIQDATPVPEAERPSLMKRDHVVREFAYTQDPMNAISERMLGKERTQRMLDVRYGKAQIEEAERAAGLQ
jgi:hypothetical protein